MTQADSVHSTPPTNTSAGQSRRSILGAIATGIVAALASTIAQPATAAAATIGPHPDAELLAMANQYAIAYKKWSDLNLAVDRMDGSRFASRGDRPEVLNRREADAELGLPSLWPYPNDHEAIWDRPIDVDPLREAKWNISSKSETDDEVTVSLRKVTPSPAARARADEIITAYDDWQSRSERLPRGYRKAKHESDKAHRAYMRLERRIANTRANTPEGMLAKVKCAQAYNETEEGFSFDDGGCPEVMARSIFLDIVRMNSKAVA
jgi:hypothetical protein